MQSKLIRTAHFLLLSYTNLKLTSMLKRKCPLLIYFVLGIVFISNSQDNKDTSRSSRSYFKASVSYLSNSVYNGRKDSVKLPYITPSIGYYNKNGLYVSGSLSYLTTTAYSGIDLFSLQTGYDFSISDKLYGGIYASKYFFNNASTDVRAETKGGVGGNINYDTKIVDISSGIGVIFSSKTDINLYGSFSHPFYFGDNFGVNPTVTGNLGSQNYYQDFITNRKSDGGSRGRGDGGRGRNGGNSGGGSTPSTVTTSSAKFGILDYEISIPLSYYGNRWGVHLTPTYAIPQNPVVVKSSINSPYTTEKLENTFYAQLSVYFKF